MNKFEVGDYVRIKKACTSCMGDRTGYITQIQSVVSSHEHYPTRYGSTVQFTPTWKPFTDAWTVCDDCIEALKLDEVPDNHKKIFQVENE